MSRSGSRRYTSSGCPIWLKEGSFLTFLVVFLPAIAAGLLLGAGADSLSVFKLEQNNNKTLISAKGYTSDSASSSGSSQKNNYLYSSPSDWPAALKDISLLLLLHFILGILIGIYTLILIILLIYQRRPYDRLTRVTKLLCSTAGVTLAGLFGALASYDASIWGKGSSDGVKPAALGYALIIAGIILGLSWLFLLGFSGFTHPASAYRQTSSRSRHRDPRSKTTVSHTRSSSRRPRRTNWFHRLTNG